MSDLSDITIGVTSFLRRGYLAECMRHVRTWLPECELIVADDGDEQVTAGSRYDWDGVESSVTHIRDMSGSVLSRQQRHTWIQLPFDAGLSQKRNAIVKCARTPFVLLFCDDFSADEECRVGVLKMLNFLDGVRYCQLVGGRVDNRPYEAYLEYKPGESIKETRAAWPSPLSPRDFGLTVGLTANYFLARTEVLRRFPWPDEMVIGGEHVCLFLDMMLANQQVSWLPGVNVKTMTLGPEAKDPRYDSYRARAFKLGHQLMKRRYDIKYYFDMNGGIS